MGGQYDATVHVEHFGTAFYAVSGWFDTRPNRHLTWLAADGGACKHLVPPRLKPGVSRTSTMTSDEQRFASEVDTFIGTVFVVAIAVSGGVAIVQARTSRWWLAGIALLPAALVIANWLVTSYAVSGDTLTIRCLSFRWTIPLTTITALRASSDIRSSPALSLNRIEIVYKTGSVLVSPRDRQAFIRAIRRGQPTVTIEGVG